MFDVSSSENEADQRRRRRRIGWAVVAGLSACAVGLFWGRWLEGGLSALPLDGDEELENNDEEVDPEESN